jgi:hypothetical protein
MKLSKLMIAVAALATASLVVAGPDAARVVQVSGASAVKGNFAFAAKTLCDTAGGVFQEWISGGNISTYVCTAAGGLSSGTTGTYASAGDGAFINFDGTDFAEIRLNVGGGSFTALQTLAGGQDRYLNVGAGATVAVGGLVANAGVTGGALVTGPGIGGFSDVQVDGFPSNVKDTVAGLDDAVANNTAIQVGVAQGFGVAASDALYSAMFTAQQTAGVIPGTCTVTDTANATCVPSISKGQMASIMSAKNTSLAKTQGAQFLASQLPANTELRYARRVDTSGTQASAQNYFLGIGSMGTPLAVFKDPSDRTNPAAAIVTTGCNANDVRGPLATNDEVDAAFVALGQIDLCDKKQGNLRVVSTPGTGDVRNELNKATIQGGAVNYALGVMSLENDGGTFRNLANVSVPVTWKWLRVQGAMPGENVKPGTAGNTNRPRLVDGSYDFYYELWSYTQASAENDAFINAMINTLNGGPALKGLTVIGSSAGQQPYSRGGRTDTPSSR